MGKRNTTVGADHTNVKTGLLSRCNSESLRDEIIRLATYISKLKDRATIFLNIHCIRCIRENIPLPDLKQDSLIYRCARLVTGDPSKGLSPELTETFRLFSDQFQDLPKLDYYVGSSQALTYASNELLTNARNSLWYVYCSL
jgi:hypothetical protein